MARKDVFAGALASLMNAEANGTSKTGKSILHSSALGGIESGLARGLQLIEIDPAQVRDSEYADRMPYAETDLNDLIASIRESGQQIPILVQREATNQYRIIYGRRRLAATRALGLQVRALVTQLDDAQRIIAQGVENAVRSDLTFIEKALFAHRLRQGGVEETTIRQALNIDVDAPKATTISSMKMVVETLGEELIETIGRAPGIGRPRWRALADLLNTPAPEFAAANRQAIVTHLAENAAEAESSDQRFARAFSYLKSRDPKNAPAKPGQRAHGEVSRNRKALTLTFHRDSNPEFHAWLDRQADALVEELHQRWLNETTPQPAQAAR